VPGQSVVYTITASNAGPSAAPNTAIADSFPALLTCSFSAVGAGGATGFTAAGAGNINDAAVSMPALSSVVYTATCSIPASAFGTLSNTATVTASAVGLQSHQQQRTMPTRRPTADLSHLIDAPTGRRSGSAVYIITANAG
jgi:uncharacterized repeat protein (TIGR01451 family)